MKKYMTVTEYITAIEQITGYRPTSQAIRNRIKRGTIESIPNLGAYIINIEKSPPALFKPSQGKRNDISRNQ